MTVKQAEIITCQATVQALVVAEKQVTLALFRQIPSEPVLGMQGELAGSIWGRVNYFWGDCRAGSHWHVVWQRRDGQLRRDCVSREDWTRECDRRAHEAHAAFRDDVGSFIESCVLGDVSMWIEDERLHLSRPGSHREMTGFWVRRRDFDDALTRMLHYVFFGWQCLRRPGTPPSPDDLWDSAAEWFRFRHEISMIKRAGLVACDRIAASPQLFIAL